MRRGGRGEVDGSRTGSGRPSISQDSRPISHTVPPGLRAATTSRVAAAAAGGGGRATAAAVAVAAVAAAAGIKRRPVRPTARTGNWRITRQQHPELGQTGSD